jgi:hypothetical protein
MIKKLVLENYNKQEFLEYVSDLLLDWSYKTRSQNFFDLANQQKVSLKNMVLDWLKRFKNLSLDNLMNMNLENLNKTIINCAESFQGFKFIDGYWYMPLDVRKELLKWSTVNRSPYSFSFYNSNDISWSHKPEGSLRISNHWNFRGTKYDSKGWKVDNPNQIHCKIKGTGPSYPSINKWLLCRYEKGEYIKLKEYKPEFLGDMKI